MDKMKSFELYYLCSEDLIGATTYVNIGLRRSYSTVKKASQRFPLVSVKGVSNYDHSLPS